jgi:hypothetical protein
MINKISNCLYPSSESCRKAYYKSMILSSHVQVFNQNFSVVGAGEINAWNFKDAHSIWMYGVEVW